MESAQAMQHDGSVAVLSLLRNHGVAETGQAGGENIGQRTAC